MKSNLALLLILFFTILSCQQKRNVEVAAPQEEPDQSESNDESAANEYLTDELDIIDSLQEAQNALDTIVSPEESKLIGSWIFGIQFIDDYGQANIYKSNGELYIEGYQSDPQQLGYCQIEGIINVVDTTRFTFQGQVGLFTEGCCGTIEWSDANLTFVKKGNRSYYRMQEIDQLCDRYTCAYYLDLVAKVSDIPNIDNGEISEEDLAYEEGMIVLEAIDEGQVEVLFHGYGTEPYWDVYVTDELILIRDLDLLGKVYTPNQVFDRDLDEQTITFDLGDGETGTLKVKKEPADDGMSDATFPYSVNLNGLPGCGDIKLMNDMSIYEDQSTIEEVE